MYSSSRTHAETRARPSMKSTLQALTRRPIHTTIAILSEPEYTRLVHALILLAEAALTLAIIHSVRFTNIDWEAYMQQISQVVAGERDYIKIRGDTGPLVYPAGFVWTYLPLYHISNAGSNIRLAQYVFGALYVATMAVVLHLYRYDGKIPPGAAVLLTFSKRLHSLYMLRLFNDCWAVFFLYLSILTICARRRALGTILFSLAISVKMSVLLMLPAWGLVMLLEEGLLRTVLLGGSLLAVQVGLGWPFLAHDWRSYVARAFDFSRVFLYKWTVNWRFIPENVFLSRAFALVLLLCHVALLWRTIDLLCSRWGGLRRVLQKTVAHPREPASVARLSPTYIINCFFLSNVVGLLCARSLHYQFYVWAAHQLVFLIWQSRRATILKIIILAGIEYGWETFPSTVFSSAILFASHVGLLYLAIPRSPRPRVVRA